MARMRERQHAAALRPSSPVPAEVPGPDTGPLPTPDADGVVVLPDVPALKAATGPTAEQVARVAGSLFWAAQSPAVADTERDKLLEARAQVLQEAALA